MDSQSSELYIDLDAEDELNLSIGGPLPDFSSPGGSCDEGISESAGRNRTSNSANDKGYRDLSDHSSTTGQPSAESKPSSPHTLLKARTHNRGRRVYIGNLTWWTTQDEIRNLIERIGVKDCTSIKMMENRLNGQFKGYCAVTVDSEESNKIIFEKLSEENINGRKPAISYTDEFHSKFEAATNEKIRLQQNMYSSNPPPHMAMKPGMAAPRMPAPARPMHHPNSINDVSGPPPTRHGCPQSRFSFMPVPGHDGWQPPPMMPPQQPWGMPCQMPIGGPEIPIHFYNGNGPPEQLGPQRPPQQHCQGPPPSFNVHGPPNFQARLSGPGGGGLEQPPAPHARNQFFISKQSEPRPTNTRENIKNYDTRDFSRYHWKSGQTPKGANELNKGQGPRLAQQSPGFTAPPGNVAPHLNPEYLHRQPSCVMMQGPLGDFYNNQFLPPSSFQIERMARPNMAPPPAVERPFRMEERNVEVEDILYRNRCVASAAISRAVADSASGDRDSAMETLVTAISLISDSKGVGDERCKILLASLEDTLNSVTMTKARDAKAKEQRRRRRSRSDDRASGVSRNFKRMHREYSKSPSEEAEERHGHRSSRIRERGGHDRESEIRQSTEGEHHYYRRRRHAPNEDEEKSQPEKHESQHGRIVEPDSRRDADSAYRHSGTRHFY